MTIDYTARLEKAKQEVTEQCLKLFLMLYRISPLPAEFTITMSAQSKETGEIRQSKTSVVIPKPISYKTMGKLTGRIRSHQVSVLNDARQHFKATIDGTEYARLPPKLVEEELGIAVRKKKTGPQVGHPSETVARAVWRHLAARYNTLDREVNYFDEFVYL